ncbi:MAG: cupredoxin domain-containing protein [Chloroflexi bacterium]|nr:cupredoxin domain-containing protein [Chloroflexota bacterium]
MNNTSKVIAVGFASALIAIGALGLVFTFVGSPFNVMGNSFTPNGGINSYAYQNATPAPNQDYGYGYGMMGRGGGMMGGGNGQGGMMGGGYGQGGMMGGFGQGGYNNQDQTAPTAVPTQAGAVPATVDQEIKISADNLRFSPSRITVKAGSTVRFVITNNDSVPHNFFSQPANIPYLALPANTTQTLVWTAPTREGTYTALCTLHPGMILQIVVTK